MTVRSARARRSARPRGACGTCKLRVLFLVAGLSFFLVSRSPGKQSLRAVSLSGCGTFRTARRWPASSTASVARSLARTSGGRSAARAFLRSTRHVLLHLLLLSGGKQAICAEHDLRREYLIGSAVWPAKQAADRNSLIIPVVLSPFPPLDLSPVSGLGQGYHRAATFREWRRRGPFPPDATRSRRPCASAPRAPRGLPPPAR